MSFGAVVIALEYYLAISSRWTNSRRVCNGICGDVCSSSTIGGSHILRCGTVDVSDAFEVRKVRLIT